MFNTFERSYQKTVCISACIWTFLTSCHRYRHQPQTSTISRALLLRAVSVNWWVFMWLLAMTLIRHVSPTKQVKKVTLISLVGDSPSSDRLCHKREQQTGKKERHPGSQWRSSCPNHFPRPEEGVTFVCLTPVTQTHLRGWRESACSRSDASCGGFVWLTQLQVYAEKKRAKHLADAGPRARHPAALKQSKFSARIELYDYNLTSSCFFPKTCSVRRGHFGKTFRFMFFRITKHQKRRGCLLWIRAGYRCDVLLTCLRLFQLYKDRRWTVSPPWAPQSSGQRAVFA